MTFLPGTHATRTNRLLFDSWAAFVPANLDTKTCMRAARLSCTTCARGQSDMRHDQRWRERPVSTARGSLAGQDRGLVHAIVGSATATPAAAAAAAQCATSMTRSRQVAAMETLHTVHGHRATGVRECLERVSKPGGQPDAIFASPPSWPMPPGPWHRSVADTGRSASGFRNPSNMQAIVVKTRR